MDEQWARIVRCRDHSGRVRDLTVGVDDDGDIYLQPPPGEVAWLSPNQIQDVKQALTDAQVESIHRRKAW